MSVPRVSPILTLTTDFGLQDHYVATMKGVILSRCPEARLVDISHDIPPFSILQAAYTIDQAAKYFPVGAVHLIVVDPGVGTPRRPVCAQALGQSFVAPDNGCLTLVAKRDPCICVRELTNRDFWLPSPSSTFHGRDIFSPVAAALAGGSARFEDLGPTLQDLELLSGLDPRQVEAGLWIATIISVDRFGNAITNLKASEFQQLSAVPFELEAGRQTVTRFAKTFGDAPPDVCFVFAGSSGYLELGMNRQSAAERLKLAPGDAVTLRLRH
ncbi:MAG: SAM-dependent chlorinase/fluorinase [Acidobacteriaceae bacterium]|nr:SAM-dependent chlorinase/fluorinase [Acidobacteriaceae bacterium]